MANKKTVSGIMKQHKLSMHKFQSRSHTQQTFWDDVKENPDKSQILWGSAGSGKTFLALRSAFDECLHGDNDYRRVVLIRSAVASRDIGFLPGTLEEKGQVYEKAFQGIIETDLFQRPGIYETLKDKGSIEFMLTSYARGITWDDSIIITDESQNMSAHELDTIITRLGENSKMYICGDYAQSDFTKNSDKDVERVMEILKEMPHDFSSHTFTTDDIVRSGIVKRYLQRKEMMLIGRNI